MVKNNNSQAKTCDGIAIFIITQKKQTLIVVPALELLFGCKLFFNKLLRIAFCIAFHMQYIYAACQGVKII